MARLNKGTIKKLDKVKVKVVHDMNNGLVVININGAYRIVRRSNLK